MPVTPIASCRFTRKRFYEKYKNLNQALSCINIDFVSINELIETLADIRPVIVCDGLCRTAKFANELNEAARLADTIADIKTQHVRLIQGIKNDLKEYAQQYNQCSERLQRIKDEAFGSTIGQPVPIKRE